MTRHAVKVTLANGKHFYTEINGTKKSIREYYAIGKVFNVGRTHDNMQAVTALEFIDGE